MDGRRGQDHAARRLVDHVAGRLPHARVVQARLAAEPQAAAHARRLLGGQHDRLDAAALGLAHDRLARRGGRARPPWRPRRPRTPPPPPWRACSAARARLSSASGTRVSSGSAIGTSKTHSASITAPPSPSSSFSSAASRPAVCMMSSSSGVPRTGTRIEPNSASARAPRQRRLGHGHALEHRLALRGAVADVERDPERPSRPAPTQRAPPCSTSSASERDQPTSRRTAPPGSAASPPRNADVERHPVRPVAVGLLVAQPARPTRPTIVNAIVAPNAQIAARNSRSAGISRHDRQHRAEADDHRPASRACGCRRADRATGSGG